jgi:hypothetical protein
LARIINIHPIPLCVACPDQSARQDPLSVPATTGVAPATVLVLVHVPLQGRQGSGRRSSLQERQPAPGARRRFQPLELVRTNTQDRHTTRPESQVSSPPLPPASRRLFLACYFLTEATRPRASVYRSITNMPCCRTQQVFRNNKVVLVRPMFRATLDNSCLLPA